MDAMKATFSVLDSGMYILECRSLEAAKSPNQPQFRLLRPASEFVKQKSGYEMI